VANYDELVKEIFDEEGGWLNIYGSAFGLLADFSGDYAFAQLAIGFVRMFIQQDDEVQQALAVIQRDFQQLTAFIAAEDKLDRMRDIDLGIKDAVAVFEQLPANMDVLPSLSQDFIQTQIQTCLAAALFFAPPNAVNEGQEFGDISNLSVVVTPTGNVGIGTPSPEAAVHVAPHSGSPNEEVWIEARDPRSEVTQSRTRCGSAWADRCQGFGSPRRPSSGGCWRP
jgi:hypothetical protein